RSLQRQERTPRVLPEIPWSWIFSRVVTLDGSSKIRARKRLLVLWGWGLRARVRRPLEFHRVALGVGEVDRDAAALGAETVPDVADGDAVLLQVGDDGLLVERLDAKAEVIHVAALAAGGGAAGLAERAVHRDEVDHARADAQVGHAEFGSIGDEARAEDVAVEARHRLDVAHAQDDVVDAADVDHSRPTSARPRCRARRRSAGRSSRPRSRPSGRRPSARP